MPDRAEHAVLLVGPLGTTSTGAVRPPNALAASVNWRKGRAIRIAIQIVTPKTITNSNSVAAPRRIASQGSRLGVKICPVSQPGLLPPL
jgi:hypothetical protein